LVVDYLLKISDRFILLGQISGTKPKYDSFVMTH